MQNILKLIVILCGVQVRWGGERGEERIRALQTLHRLLIIEFKE